MSILGNIKKGVQQSGSNKGKVLYLKKDSKVRVRFLQEIEDGTVLTMHDSFSQGINAICQDHVGKECPYCEDTSLRHREAYIYSVWDYDAKEVKLFTGFANNFSPLPNFVAMHEAYETLIDRDYVIQRDGDGTNTRYSVVPMDKVKFKNTKAKPYSEKKLIDIMDKAFPVDDAHKEDDEEETPLPKSKKDKGAKGKKQRKPEPEDIEEDEFEEEVENENEYSEMTPKELYMECMERGLKAKKKQKAKYYIDMLVEDDENSDDDDWDDEEDDDENDW